MISIELVNTLRFDQVMVMYALAEVLKLLFYSRLKRWVNIWCSIRSR